MLPCYGIILKKKIKNSSFKGKINVVMALNIDMRVN